MFLRVVSTIFSCALPFLQLSTCIAEEVPAGKQPPVLQLNGEIEILGAGRTGSYTVEVGEVPVDRHIDLTLVMVNHSKDRLNFDGATVSCSCIKASLPQGVIEPGDNGTCNIILDTGKRQDSHTFQIPIRFSDSSKLTNDIVVSVNGYLTGFLGFQEKFSVAEIARDEPFVDLAVRFNATSPIVGDLIHAEHSPKIGALSFRKVPKSVELWELIIRCDTTKIPSEGVVTSLLLEDVATGRKSECNLLVTRDQSVRIAPYSLRLSQQGDDAKKYAGNCIITVRAPESQGHFAKKSGEKGERLDSAMPVVSASIRGKELAISLKRLNHEHFRVVATISKNAVDQLREHPDFDKTRVNWSLSTEQGARQFNAPVVLVDRDSN